MKSVNVLGYTKHFQLKRRQAIRDYEKKEEERDCCDDDDYCPGEYQRAREAAWDADKNVEYLMSLIEQESKLKSIMDKYFRS
jgi:hypothetical protein